MLRSSNALSFVNSRRTIHINLYCPVKSNQTSGNLTFDKRILLLRSTALMLRVQFKIYLHWSILSIFLRPTLRVTASDRTHPLSTYLTTPYKHSDTFLEAISIQLRYPAKSTFSGFNLKRQRGQLELLLDLVPLFLEIRFHARQSFWKILNSSNNPLLRHGFHYRRSCFLHL